MEKKMMKSNGVDSRSSAMKRRRLFSAAAVLLAVCLVFVGAVGAETTYYVSPNGNQDGSSVDSPSNLTAVLNLIKTGTDNEYVVYLLEGVYNNNDGYIIERASTTLKAYDNAKVTIKSTLNVHNINNGKIIFEKLGFSEIRNANGAIDINDPRNVAIHTFIVENCEFNDCGFGIKVRNNNIKVFKVLNTNFTSVSSGIYGRVNSASDFVISGCKMIDMGSGLNLLSTTAGPITIENNLIEADTFCLRFGEASVTSKSISITGNKLSVTNPVTDPTTSTSGAVAFRGNTIGDLIIHDNVLEGSLLLNFGPLSQPVTSTMSIGNNYWNGENPVGPASPLINWGDSVSKPESIPYYLNLDENGDIDEDSFYDGLTYTISIGENDYGDVNLNPELDYGYPVGSEITINPEPATGYELTSIVVVDEDSNAVSVSDNKFTMPGNNVTVTVSFAPIEYAIILTQTDGGVVSASISTAHYGDEIALTATPNEGYRFNGWIVTPEVDISPDGKFTMPASNVEVNAHWEIIPPAPSSSSGSSSSGSYLSFPRTTTNGGLVDFGSSKVVKALMLPEGSSGSVLLKVDTVEKWPKALETEYTFDISVEKLGEGMAYIHFEIPVSTLESLELTPADICAYHFEGEVWTKLPTTYEVKDGTVCYEAETDSFSPFKLVIEEGAATQKEEENVPTVPPTEEPDVPDEPEILPPIDEPTKPTEPTEPETPAPILAVLAGLGAAFIVRRK